MRLEKKLGSPNLKVSLNLLATCNIQDTLPGYIRGNKKVALQARILLSIKSAYYSHIYSVL